MKKAEKYVSEKSMKKALTKVLAFGLVIGILGGITFHEYGLPAIERKWEQDVHEFRMIHDEDYIDAYYKKHPVEWIKTKF